MSTALAGFSGVGMTSDRTRARMIERLILGSGGE